MAGLPSTLLILLAILCSCAFFSISETAFFSLQKMDREILKEDPQVGELLQHLLRWPHKLLAALLIGGELSNIGLSAVSATVILSITPTMPWLNILLVAPILILFGDVLPKTLGFRFARPIVRAVIGPLAWWSALVNPLRRVFIFLVDLLLRPFGVQPLPVSESLQEDQLRTLIDQGRATGIIQPIEQEIIHRVFEFGDLPVSRLMTPRPDIFSLSLTTPWPELLAEIDSARYSRVPIWQNAPDNIIGILLVKDLLQHRENPPANARQLQRILHPVMYVPPSKRAQDLMREFRARNNHMAVVVDEHGSIAGLVTLDDLLTELVGEVLDESDVEEKEAVQVQDHV